LIDQPPHGTQLDGAVQPGNRLAKGIEHLGLSIPPETPPDMEIPEWPEQRWPEFDVKKKDD
jgi:hypothetical protein